MCIRDILLIVIIFFFFEDLQIQRVFRQNASDFHFATSGEENYVKIPSQNFNENGKYVAEERSQFQLQIFTVKQKRFIKKSLKFNNVQTSAV